MCLPFRIYLPVSPNAAPARVSNCAYGPRAHHRLSRYSPHLCRHHLPRLLLTAVCSGVRSGHSCALCPGKKRDPRPVYWRGRKVGHRVLLEKLSMELCRIEWTEGNFLVFSKVYFCCGIKYDGFFNDMFKLICFC